MEIIDIRDIRKQLTDERSIKVGGTEIELYWVARHFCGATPFLVCPICRKRKLTLVSIPAGRFCCRKCYPKALRKFTDWLQTTAEGKLYARDMYKHYSSKLDPVRDAWLMQGVEDD